MKNILLSLFLIFSLISLPGFCESGEDAAIFYNEAIDCYSQNEVEKSIDLFKKAVELDPDFYEAYYNLSQILMSLERNDEAIVALKQIVRLRPDDYESYYNLGRLQYKKGYLASAHEYLNKIDISAPQYESAKIVLDKIEKRQFELDLERKIKERRISYNSQGQTLGDNLVEIKAPSGIAVDSKGNIYSASFSENAIYKISTLGKKTLLSKSEII
ncbi:tetratricopeptide repeat protein, partial [bacterium]|nr:tetratricopeptide repeat protein [bacterium]